jgi:hypothetical protein
MAGPLSPYRKLSRGVVAASPEAEERPATSLGGPFPFGQGHSDGANKLAPSYGFSLAAIEQLFILHQRGFILAPLKRSPSKWLEILMCFFLKLPTF